MSSIAEIIRQADERLRAQVNIAAGLTDAAAANRLDEVRSPDDAAVARQVLAERRRALDTAQRRVQLLDHVIQHLSRVTRFREEGWPQERVLLEQAISEDAQDGLASWLNYWFAAASSRRIGALRRLQSDVALPPGASIVAERMSVATRALAEKDWQLCHEILETGSDGVDIGPRQVPDRQAKDKKEPDHSVREDLRLMAARLALHDGLAVQAETVLGKAQTPDTASHLALQARLARLRNADSEAESLLSKARGLDPGDLDVAAESIAQARKHGEPDTALGYARSAAEALLSLADVEADIGRLVDPPAELWYAVAERALDEGDPGTAQRFLDRAAAAARRNDDEIMAAIEEKHADLSVSVAERHRALLSAGARRTGLGQLEMARRDYEAAASGQPADEEDGRVQASARLRWADVASTIARQRPYSDFAAKLDGILSHLLQAQAHVDVSGAESWSYLTESDLRIQASRDQDRPEDRYAREWAALLAAARAAALNPAWARPWLTLAHITAACGLYQVAEATAQRAHELGRDETTRAGYAMALIRTGRYEAALDLLGGESDAWSRCARGHIALMLGKTDEAVDHFAGVTIGRTWYWAWYSYICALAIIGDLTAAQLKSAEFMTAVADRKGERAWLHAAAFDARIRGQLTAAREHAEHLLQAAGPADVKARQVMGETQLLAGDHTGWDVLANALAEDPEPAAINAWERQEQPVLDILAAAQGLPLEFAFLRSKMSRVQTRPRPDDPMEELRWTAAVQTAYPEAAKAARLTEAALRAVAGAADQDLDDLLRGLANEDGLRAEAESLRRHIARLKAQDSQAMEAPGQESTGGQAAPDDLPVLQLRLPTSWLPGHAGPGHENQLLIHYVSALRTQRRRALPRLQAAAGDELEPGRYQILRDGSPLSDSRIDPGLRYCPGDTLPLLPMQVRTDPRIAETYGLGIPADIPGSDRGLTALLTISAAEVIALLYADAARDLGIPLTAPGDDQPRPDEEHTRPAATGTQAGLDLNQLSYRRWEMRGRPSGSPWGSDADWNAAKRLRHQLTKEMAYFRWVNRHRPLWDSCTDWFAAEAEIASGRASQDQLPGTYVEERLRHQLIEEVAYFHWVRRNRPRGDPQVDWLAAEAEVNKGLNRTAFLTGRDAYASSINTEWLHALRRAFSRP